MISILGALFVLATGMALVLRPNVLPWILSAAVPFSATAGMTIAGQSIVMYPLVALVVIGVAVRRSGIGSFLAADVSMRPGLRPLIAFGVWAIAVTVVAPIAFAGIPVLDPRQGIDDGVKAPASLALGVSNLAQVGYLAIGIATVVALASWPGVSPRVPAAGLALGTVLSSVRSLLPDSFTKALFDNSANVSYTAGTFDGVERMRGIFSEPSAFGAFSVAAAVFFLLSASRERGPGRVVFSMLGLWSLVNAVLSFSGGAVVSGLVVFALAAGQKTYAYVTGRLKLTQGGVVTALVVSVALVVAAPAISSFVSMIFTDKAGSSSYENRNAADAFSYNVAAQTFGLGAGVGSNRPSSFIASILSTTGLLGSVLFALAVVLIAVRAARDVRAWPAVGALVAIMFSKIVAGPDVSEPAMWFLLALCASTAWRGPGAGDGARTDDVGEPSSSGGMESARVPVAAAGGRVPR